MLTTTTPYFLISKKKIFQQLQILKDLGLRVSYSWKTNPTIGKILERKKACFFSVHSIEELKQMNSAKQTWFFALALTTKELDILITRFKQTRFVVDNLTDLSLLVNYCQTHSISISLLLRMKLKEHTVFTGKHYVFGMSGLEVKKQILELKKNSHIKEIGIHVHRKTQNVSEWSLTEEFSQTLGEEVLNSIDIINIGGGLPASYKNTHNNSQQSIFKKICLLKTFLAPYNISLYIEPGRFIAAPSVRLISHITAIQETTCFLDVSIFNGCMDTVIANIKLPILQEKESGTRYLLKGRTPDSCDIIRYAVYLETPKVGDVLIFENAGAYTYTTNFCGLEKIEERVVEGF